MLKTIWTKTAAAMGLAIWVAASSQAVWAVQIGQAAPTTHLRDLSGNGVLDLRQYLGKVVLVDFWASWCPPCRKSLPQFNELRSELVGYGFEVFAINVDEEVKDGQDFFNKIGVDYPSAMDPEGKMPEAWQIQGMPTSFLVDKKGVVRMVHAGFKDGDIELMKAEIIKLVKE